MVVDKEDHSFAGQLVALREADEETEEDTLSLSGTAKTLWGNRLSYFDKPPLRVLVSPSTHSA